MGDSSRSRSHSPPRKDSSAQKPTFTSKNKSARRYRAKEASTSQVAAIHDAKVKAALLAKEDEMLKREAAVAAAFEAAVQGPEVQRRIAARLAQERAKLEEEVTAQLEVERRALLERRRREQEESRRRQEDLDRILEENRRKVEEAQQRAAMEREQREQDRRLRLEASAAMDL